CRAHFASVAQQQSSRLLSGRLGVQVPPVATAWSSSSRMSAFHTDDTGAIPVHAISGCMLKKSRHRSAKPVEPGASPGQPFSRTWCKSSTAFCQVVGTGANPVVRFFRVFGRKALRIRGPMLSVEDLTIRFAERPLLDGI